VNILNLLTHLSNNPFDKESLAALIKNQPQSIQSAIESNDIEGFKLCIADKKVYVNEVKVTSYL